MKGISSIGPVLEAPELRELSLLKIVPVAREDIPLLQRHPTLERFDWSFEDVPRWMYEPVTQAITLPRARAMHPEEWRSEEHTSELKALMRISYAGLGLKKQKRTRTTHVNIRE